MSTTTVVAAEGSDAEEPSPFVAVTKTLMKYPTSESDTTYEVFVAAGISVYESPEVNERFH
jgi:hypothetical protein